MAKLLNPGQPIRSLPCGSLNRAILMARDLRALTPAGGPQPSGASAESARCVTRCKNFCGKDLKERSIVGIRDVGLTLPEIDVGDPDGDLADAAVLLGDVVEIELPDLDKHGAGMWGVTLGPIEDEKEGYVAIGGLVKCRVDRTSVSHKKAVIKTGETDFLESADDGTVVTAWKKQAEADPADRIGKQWCQVNLGAGGAGSTIVRGVLTGTIPAATCSDSSGTAASTPGRLDACVRLTSWVGSGYSGDGDKIAGLNSLLTEWGHASRPIPVAGELVTVPSDPENPASTPITALSIFPFWLDFYGAGGRDLAEPQAPFSAAASTHVQAGRAPCGSD